MTDETGMLKTDPEFRRLIFPLSRKEYAALEDRILQDGCSHPVTVWYGYIIRGFEIYEICTMRHLAFEIKHINFRVREEVISMICREELSSRCLPESQRRYLIGKRYNADTVIGAHNAAGTDQFRERIRRELSKSKKLYESSAGLTKQRLAGEYHLSLCSVARYAAYARGIDHIASVKPEMADQILSGGRKASMETVIACCGTEEHEMIKRLTVSGENRNTKKSGGSEKEMITGTTIKDMPAFDPDAEINSLALTIPSWVRSIDRTRSTVKFSLLTSGGRDRLEQELYRLQEAAEMMARALKEVQ